ncbi:hypothetical protein [Streptomyces sp. VRA16 Mangrove soil]|uniref:WXG100-like domain-containing protein n=1 Tax=Streptomyces sp. VRA16 Mangrove soil TaxID=2817434 RepID=UPI001A9E5D84|nr:hypothetical protein [Streptomyces sp. VRA16 Mangrove soil]MBO1336369.1 hypothetical protein [Streptomyces sp. VRA16 Mangrove soil]
MTLTVRSEDVVGYAGLVHRAAEDCRSAREYLDRSTGIDRSVAADLWDRVLRHHEEHVRDARGVLNRFDAILNASRSELKKTAAWYDAVDLDTARRLDATYPSTSTSVPVHRTRPQGSASFRDVRDALSRLKPPGGADGWLQGHLAEIEFAPTNKAVGTLLDFASPSALANEGLKLVFGWDILGYFANLLGGDWQSYAGCADAWKGLGDACADMAENIRHGNSTLGITWRGNAADAAWKYFDNIAKKLDGTRDSLHDLSDLCRRVATLVYSLAETAKGILADICDDAIQFAVASAASAALLASGVGFTGGFVGVAFAAERAASMIAKYESLVGQYDHLMLAVNAAFAAGGLLGSVSKDLRDFPVVGKSYDNALV